MGFPLFAEALVQIFCSELNLYKQKWRTRKATELIEGTACSEDEKLEAGHAAGALNCVASVVGYREDETVWRKCLESYRDNYDGCVQAICMGIDGNQVEDLDMVQTAEEVFGLELTVIDLDETFGALASKVAITGCSSPVDSPMLGPTSEKVSLPGSEMEGVTIMEALVSRATAILNAHGVLHLSERGPVRPVCITQPHHSKKEIMFTTFIFSLAMAQANDIDFMWSSDSDSWVYPGTLDTAIRSIYPDERIGGTATRFSIHNAKDSTIACLAAATYEADFALQIGLLSSCDTTDCQPGPCALFRRKALEEIVLPWPPLSFPSPLTFPPKLVNDDRHLTTRLLLAHHSVTSNPSITTATDTPVTIPRYILQQTRWARASFVEATCYPRIFLLHHPILCLSTFRRFYIPGLNILIVTRYLATGTTASFSSLPDILARLLVASLYSAFALGKGWSAAPLHAASMLLFQAPQAAFQVWAALSMFENQWATGARSKAERSRVRRCGVANWVGQGGPLVVTAVWLGLVVAALGKCLAGKLGWGDWDGVAALGGFVGMVVAFVVAVWRGG
ncbi:hypothetical protein CAC42_4707 [Sphaceloma murrayae]|uniref:Glycosyltransferase 2-like domain-containing protein n=1 Tax=Sphaceloma murrayae TaxID=2082308 RepID=A0A2K1QPD9_9PEZI|nr:hypothetical protein CAC42_4707 [Sphaceloma murrayae]